MKDFWNLSSDVKNLPQWENGTCFPLHLQEQGESLAQQLANQLEDLPGKGIGFFPVRPPAPGLANSFYLLNFSNWYISNEAVGDC